MSKKNHVFFFFAPEIQPVRPGCLGFKFALENIRIIENERMIANAGIEGRYLGEAIKEILERYAGGRDFDVRQCGLMIGVDWNDNPGLSMRFLLKMLKRGLMWCASWDYSTMIALPPLIITRTDSDYALNIFEDTAKEMFPIK